MKRIQFLLSVALLLMNIVSSIAQSSIFDITVYGAKGDGVSLNTGAFKLAIDACDKQGGGVIYVPSGKFLTGPIQLKSNIELHLSVGAIILASQQFSDYPLVQTRWEGIDAWGYSPFIFASNSNNIIISGSGIIDGQGDAWWSYQRTLDKMGEEVMPSSVDEKKLAELNKLVDSGEMVGSHSRFWKSQFLRPPLIQFFQCSNILVRDVTLMNSMYWTLHPVYCKDVTIDGIKIRNPKTSPNTDGINPDSSTNVKIINCHIDVGDDCITIKSGRDKPGRTRGIPSENIIISNCTMLAGHGGVVIGSEMSGGIKNVLIQNCIFDGTSIGIRIKTMRGRGGVVENVIVNGILMRNVGKAIHLNLAYINVSEEPISDRTPIVQNISFSNLRVTDSGVAAELTGISESLLRTISVSNSSFQTKAGVVGSYIHDLVLKDLTLNTSTESIFLSNSSEIHIEGVKNQENNKTSLVSLHNCENSFLLHSQPAIGSISLVALYGASTKNIFFHGNNLRQGTTLYLKDGTVDSKHIFINK